MKKIIVKLERKIILVIVFFSILAALGIIKYISPAAAAVTTDAYSFGSRTSGSSLTISHTTSGSNRLMLVGVSVNISNGAQSVDSVTYGGANLIRVGQVVNGDVRSEIWRLVAPPTGTANVVVTLSGSLCGNCGFIAGVTTFNGVHQTTPLGVFASNSGNSTTASVSVSSGNNELVFDTVVGEGVDSLSVGSGQTQRWNVTAGSSAAIAYGGASTENGAASVTMSWNLGSANVWAIGGVSIKPAAVATNTPTIAPTATRTPTPSSTPANTQKFTATEDTHTRSGNPTNNYCNVDLSVNNNRTTFLKFNLNSLSGQTISTAKLFLKVSSSSTATQIIHQVNNNSWSECTLNYNSQPTIGSQIATINGGVLNQWVEIDITSHVQTKLGSIMSLAIDSAVSNQIDFYSKEDSGNEPYLEIVTVSLSPTPTNAPTPTQTPTPTIIPTAAASPTSAPIGPNLDSVNSIYSYSGLGFYTLSPAFDGNRTQNKDVTIFLISGSLEIKENFQLSDPQDSVAFIVNGNIYIDGNVTRIPGLYISSQTFTIAASENPIIIDGMVYANRMNLARTYLSTTEPTYQFIYQPKYIIDLLPYLGRPQVNWQELR